MANNVAGNPWILDAAATITTDTVRVAKLRWSAEAAAAGDNVVVSDSAGRVVWEAVATGTNNTVESPNLAGNSGDIRGFVLTTINSGKLYVYYA